MWLSERLDGLSRVSPQVAWKLVDTLFQQAKALINGAITYILLGAICFIGTGSYWYLAGLAFSLAILGWRVWLSHRYTISRDSALPVVWARRSLVGAWLTAAGWGAWSTAILLEHDRTIVIMVAGTQAANLIGAAVRNCGMPIIAQGQIFLTLTPLFVVCLASGNPYLICYSVFVALHVRGALALTKFLHHQTLQLLLRSEEKSDLVDRLETAKHNLESLNAHLESLVLTDALTGIANRRGFDLAYAREWRRSTRENTPLSLLLLDVDLFKSYNDYYGHPAGDLCLQEVASTIASAMRRPGDFVARYGGEEFAVILPQTDREAAARVGERIKRAFTDAAIPHDSDHSFGNVSVSIGAASTFATAETTMEALSARADDALYNAKRGGRNRVHVAAMPALIGGDEVFQNNAGGID